MASLKETKKKKRRFYNLMIIIVLLIIIATGFMALGMMLPGMISGYMQQWLGYDGFFVWVVIAALPALLLLKFIKYPADFGKKTTVPNE